MPVRLLHVAIALVKSHAVIVHYTSTITRKYRPASIPPPHTYNFHLVQLVSLLFIARISQIVAKRKTLFDDRPIEISELTYIIRQDIASLNTQIASLQSYVRSQKEGTKSASKQGGGVVDEHNTNVVMLLQSRLANMGMGFKDVLELRTQVSG